MPISNISNGEAGSSVRTSLNQVIDFVNSLGTPTTVGVSILDSTNPSAVTFLRANADNTVTWLSAADFRTAIGLGSIATQESNAASITGGTITGLTNLGVSMANNTAMTGFSLGTLSDTTSRPLNITQTWNNAGLTATALKVAVTNTSSNAASKIFDFLGGASGTTSLLSMNAAGKLTCMAAATTGQWDFGSTVTFASGFYTSGSMIFNNATSSVSNATTTTFLTMSDIALNRTYTAMLAGVGQSVALKIYNTYAYNSTTADGFFLGFNSNIGYIETESGSTGTVREMVVGAGRAYGTDITGKDTTLHSGAGTGTGGSGNLLLQTAAAGSTGTTLNTLRTVLKLNADGTMDSPTMTVEAASDPASTHKLTLYVNGTRYKLLAIQE